jgi:hypothetical protein
MKGVGIAMGAAMLMLVVAEPARAVEPRPWLCRDKPVFSSNQPMSYDASLRGGGHWVMIFMRFDPSGGHDGFTVYDTRDVTGRVTGTLERGQWYGVGMYREGSHWICSAQADENDQVVPGVVRDYCYGRTAGSCDVELIVRENKSGAAPGATSP